MDAHDGSVLNAYSPTAHALNRRVIDFGVGTVFTEGGAVPTEPQAKLVVDIIEVLYNAMKNVGGWDGWDLNGTCEYYCGSSFVVFRLDLSWSGACE